MIPVSSKRPILTIWYYFIRRYREILLVSDVLDIERKKQYHEKNKEKACTT